MQGFVLVGFHGRLLVSSAGLRPSPTATTKRTKQATTKQSRRTGTNALTPKGTQEHAEWPAERAGCLPASI